jgi:hypothetical protein
MRHFAAILALALGAVAPVAHAQVLLDAGQSINIAGTQVTCAANGTGTTRPESFCGCQATYVDGQQWPYYRVVRYTYTQVQRYEDVLTGNYSHTEDCQEALRSLAACRVR